MTRKILIALCVLFVMPVFVITGCDEVQENLTPKSSFIADFSCEYRKMNITGKLSASGKKLINISLDSPNTVSYNFFTQLYTTKLDFKTKQCYNHREKEI